MLSTFYSDIILLVSVIGLISILIYSIIKLPSTPIMQKNLSFTRIGLLTIIGLCMFIFPYRKKIYIILFVVGILCELVNIILVNKNKNTKIFIQVLIAVELLLSIVLIILLSKNFYLRYERRMEILRDDEEDDRNFREQLTPSPLSSHEVSEIDEINDETYQNINYEEWMSDQVANHGWEY